MATAELCRNILVTFSHIHTVLFGMFASSFLHSRLRTCTLRSDHEGQSTLMNLLLRNYLSYNLYDQADKLVSKATFPETASNNEWARYLFYLGKLGIVAADVWCGFVRPISHLRFCCATLSCDNVAAHDCAVARCDFVVQNKSSQHH